MKPVETYFIPCWRGAPFCAIIARERRKERCPQPDDTQEARYGQDGHRHRRAGRAGGIEHHILRSHGLRQALRPPGQMARAGMAAVSGDGLLRRAGGRAGHADAAAQDEALVFQGVLSHAADPADRAAGCGRILPVQVKQRG